MNFTYLIILAAVLIISPSVLKLASTQKKETKQQLKIILFMILSAQILLGFLNWENFTSGRNGFELALTYPDSLLGLFFLITLLQAIFLLVGKSLNSIVVSINFINTVLFIIIMIRLSSFLGFQAVSLASIGTVFLVLIGNVLGLAFINKDKNLLKKYAGQKGFFLIHLSIVIGIILVGGVLLFPRVSPLLIEKAGEQLEQVASTRISPQLAVENVKKLPEVQEYLKNVSNGKVEVDNELEGEYNVHVYEVKNGHTATFNWYRVSIKSAEVGSEFSIEQQQQSPKTNKESSASQVPTGIVSGKICYPSEVIPKGKLEVKRLMDDYIISENYPGSITGAKPAYSFQLEPGDYYIRYNVDDKIFGFSTTVCPTGNEETCADTKQRIPVMAVVKEDQELKNYDLCDYYYKDSNTPKF